MNNNKIEQSKLFKKIDLLVVKAIAEAVEINRKLGTPVYIYRDGKIVDISAESLEKNQ